MKKFTLIITIAITTLVALFFYFQKTEIKEEKNKPIVNTQIKQISTPIKKQQEKDLENIKLDLNPNFSLNRENNYKNEQYSKPLSIKEADEKKKEDLDINFGVDINKKEKAIDGINLGIEKKF